MRIGVPSEIKSGEQRVALTPAGVRELVRGGHDVFLQQGAGLGSGFDDAAFHVEGARLVPTAEALWDAAEFIVKVKEPQPEEVALLRDDHLLFAYLHLAPAPELTRGLLDSRATAVAFETVTDAQGRLPLLAPMSEVAGRLALQFGVMHLTSQQGGRGVLAGGVPGVRPARVTVVGGGVVGENAARMAIGLGCDTTLLDRNMDRLRDLERMFAGRARTVAASDHDLELEIADTDLLIGAVLAPGGLAPHVVRREHLSLMGKGAVLVDVSIDQGGCAETSRPTTHTNPTFIVDGVVHNCVANLPGAVPRTSTQALVNAILPYVLLLADRGFDEAALADPGLAAGLNVSDGVIRHPAVAEAFAQHAEGTISAGVAGDQTSA